MEKTLTLLYHEVTDFPEKTGFQRKSANPYKHPLKEFIAHIDLVKNSGKRVLTINDYPFNKKEDTIFLTFDDGGKSALQAADILEEKNMRGHFFITTSMINNKYFVNEQDIRELQNRGHIIGSHSHSHPNVFKSLSKDKMISEWRTSKKKLEDLLGLEITSCSIPGGDANRNTYKTAFDEGYSFVFNSDPSLKIACVEENRYIIGRVCPKKGKNINQIERYIQFKDIKKELLTRKVKNNIKTLIFPVYSVIHNNNKHREG
ncbi:polysaccharide deacetylase family protein [Aquimarina sp. AD1]|uniref:polysaccharide deacetylase family protein n=1 Tax=Aquimarina sp. (strain AD1) TaxID=1714848 RepID=UPI000E5202C7|nr:polysaccharide deacetylase family protein [Aquimarina sp. AD1]AXT57336.1 polysaccharide deacetylase family protein [Aquimarina sp. AD1]RKN04731.1 polysaccharide deacetylase family protein [Aquimarina sp. AD1]